MARTGVAHTMTDAGLLRSSAIVRIALVVVAVATGASLLAQAPRPQQPAGNVSPTVAGITPPADYVIGADDVLTVVFWREKEMSSDVTVRPDGKISLPLLNDVQAAGLTPEQLRLRLVEASRKFFEEPTVTVVVKTINSRKVFIMGQVPKPGTYPLTGPMNVMQLLALAGGPLDFADDRNIVIMRTENGQQSSFNFNYREVVGRRNLKQNIELKPGDTVVVP